MYSPFVWGLRLIFILSSLIFHANLVEAYKKELQEIIDQVASAKNRLAEVTEAMDFDDREIDSLDEALDALDDAIDIMTDSLEEEE